MIKTTLFLETGVRVTAPPFSKGHLPAHIDTQTGLVFGHGGYGVLDRESLARLALRENKACRLKGKFVPSVH